MAGRFHHRLIFALGAMFVWFSGSIAAAAEETATDGPLNGAAMCVQAARVLSSNGGDNPDLHRAIFSWDAIVRAIPATQEERAAALDRAAQSYREVAENGAAPPLAAAQGMVAACGGRDLQYGYIEQHSTPELKVTEGLSGAAMCVAISEYVAANDANNARATTSLVGGWTRALTAISADAAVRDAAIQRARGTVEASQAQNPVDTLRDSQIFLRDICAGRQRLIDYLTLWGSADAMNAAEGHE